MNLFKTNWSGTMAQSFSIGKLGPTIHQGGIDPSATLGLGGDLYIKLGSRPKLYVKSANGWKASSDPVLDFKRQVVTGTDTVLDDATYVGVAASGPCTVTLPTGDEGKRLVVKDEGGTAGSHAITLSGAAATIDRAADVAITQAFGAVTLVYGGSEWHVV